MRKVIKTNKVLVIADNRQIGLHKSNATVARSVSVLVCWLISFTVYLRFNVQYFGCSSARVSEM